MPILSAKDYAAHRGVTAQAVSKAIKSGRLAAALVAGLGKKPRIDSDIADREWASKTDPAKVRAEAPASSDPAGKIGNTPTMAFGLPHGAKEPPAASPFADYQDSRARREHYQSEIARVELEEKLGQLIPAEEVGKRWAAIAALVRAKVLAIAHKTKQRIPELAGEHVSILEELAREALEDLAAEGDRKEEAAVG